MDKPFIIYALPRSRTAWLSKFLTYGEWTCHHDIVTDMHTVTELRDFLRMPHTGTAETGMIEGYKLQQKILPDARIVVVRRSVKDVMKSLQNVGIEIDQSIIEHRAFLLDELTMQERVPTVSYEELKYETFCKKIFEHCLREPFDKEWWMGLRDCNIQIDVPARIEKLRRNSSLIESMKSQVVSMV